MVFKSSIGSSTSSAISCNGMNEIAERLDAKMINTVNANRKIIERLGLFEGKWLYDFEKDCSLENWLYFLANSKFVVTDSFHAICLSIVLKKPFVFIKRDSTSEAHGLDKINTILSLFNIRR